MMTVTFYVVVGIVVVLGIAWFTGRHKTNSKRTSTEKLANTLQRKFDKFINDLNKKLRTPKDIQDEMLEALDDYKRDKIESVKDAVTNLTITESNIDGNLEQLYKAKNNILEQVKKMKKLSDVDENLGGHLMMQIDSLDKSIITSRKAKENIKNQVLDINAAVTKFCNKIEMKRAEVLTLIANYVAMNCNASVKFDIDLSDLISDYTTEMTVIQRTSKIDELTSNSIQDDEESVAPEAYVKKFNDFEV